MRNISKLAVVLLAGSIVGTACVSSGTFEAKEAELATALKEAQDGRLIAHDAVHGRAGVSQWRTR